MESSDCFAPEWSHAHKDIQAATDAVRTALISSYTYLGSILIGAADDETLVRYGIPTLKALYEADHLLPRYGRLDHELLAVRKTLEPVRIGWCRGHHAHNCAIELSRGILVFLGPRLGQPPEGLSGITAKEWDQARTFARKQPVPSNSMIYEALALVQAESLAAAAARDTRPNPPCPSRVHPAGNRGRTATPPEAHEGDVDGRGRIRLADEWHRFGPQQTRLLAWVLQNPGGRIEEAAHTLGMDRHRIDRLLLDLRRSLGKKLKNAGRTLLIDLDGTGVVNHRWVANPCRAMPPSG
jgi:hypothetical protein